MRWTSHPGPCVSAPDTGSTLEQRLQSSESSEEGGGLGGARSSNCWGNGEGWEWRDEWGATGRRCLSSRRLLLQYSRKPEGGRLGRSGSCTLAALLHPLPPEELASSSSDSEPPLTPIGCHVARHKDGRWGVIRMTLLSTERLF